MKAILILTFSLLSLSHIIAQSPQNIVNKGLQLEQSGKSNQAFIKYNKAIKLNTADFVAVMAYLYRGNLFKKEQQLDRARQDYDAAAKIAEKNNIKKYTLLISLYSNRGLIRHEAKNSKGALEDFDKVILYAEKDKSATAEQYALRALFNFEQKKKQAACDDFSRALKIDASIIEDPKFAKAYKRTKTKCSKEKAPEEKVAE